MKILSVATIAAAFAVSGQAVAETAADTVRIHQIEQALSAPVKIEGRPSPARTIAELMADKQVPAVSIAFVDDGKIAWVRSYGLADIAARRAATPATLFQAGSISKPVAATGAMVLVQSGKLKLDVPVNDQLKSWKLPDNDFTRATPVTLRHLLTHTGGVTVHGFAGYEAGKPVPTVLQVLDGLPPANSDPIRVDEAVGKEWRYSGGGITIAQLMMTEASGQSFPTLLKTRVLAPFGMTSSTYEQPLPAALVSRASVGYRAKAAPIPGLRNTYPEMAAAGLWTTPTDLARWIIGMQDALAGRSRAVLDQPTAQAMMTSGMGHWGLGVEVKGEGRDMSFGHGGANEGFRAEMIAWPGRRQGVAIMTNSDDGENVMQPLLHAIARSYGWPGYEDKTIKPAPVEPGALKPFTGRYALGSTIISIREHQGGRSLDLVPPGDSSYELIPQGGDAFADASSADPARFTRDASGKIVGLDFAGVTLTRAPAQ